MIKIKTNSPIAITSPDFLVQQEKNLMMSFSAAEDNSTDLLFIDEISRFIANKKKTSLNDLSINVLDLGCGGGQLCVDFSKKSYVKNSIGLDGVAGTLNLYNWYHYKNNLFNVDISKEFSILNEDDEIMKFDLITSWEVIEHLTEDDLEVFFENSYKHLSEDGIFIGSIALFPDTRDEFGFHQDHPNYNPKTKQYILHQSVFPEEKWRNDILSKYKVLEYPLKNKNYKCGYLAVRDHPKDHNGNGGSFYFMITK